MYEDETTNTVHIEEADQCWTCDHFNKGISCPLLQALVEQCVFLDEEYEVIIRECGFYKKYERHLKAVPSKVEEAQSSEE